MPRDRPPTDLINGHGINVPFSRSVGVHAHSEHRIAHAIALRLTGEHVTGGETMTLDLSVAVQLQVLFDASATVAHLLAICGRV